MRRKKKREVHGSLVFASVFFFFAGRGGCFSFFFVCCFSGDLLGVC